MKTKVETKAGAKKDLSQMKLIRVNIEGVGNEFDYSKEFYWDLALAFPGRPEVIVARGCGDQTPPPKINEAQAAEACGEETGRDFRRRLFRENPKIFHLVSDMHPEMKEEAMGGERTRTRVERARKAMLRAIEEYEEAASRRSGRKINVMFHEWSL